LILILAKTQELYNDISNNTIFISIKGLDIDYPI